MNIPSLLTNPSRVQIESMLAVDRYGCIRGIVTEKDAFVWSGDEAMHEDVASFFGLTDALCFYVRKRQEKLEIETSPTYMGKYRDCEYEEYRQHLMDDPWVKRLVQ